MTDYPAFKVLMGQLCAAWNRPESPTLLDAYWTTLNKKGVSDLELVRAVAQVLAESEKWPAPAALIGVALRYRADHSAPRQHYTHAPDPIPQEKWDALKKEVGPIEIDGIPTNDSDLLERKALTFKALKSLRGNE